MCQVSALSEYAFKYYSNFSKCTEILLRVIAIIKILPTELRIELIDIVGVSFCGLKGIQIKTVEIYYVKLHNQIL